MHHCTCCTQYQQELTELNHKHQALLLDLPLLRERAVLARQTLQLYKEENVRLNQTRVELLAKVQQLEEGGREGGGREGRRVDELVRVLNCKNG